MMGKYINPAFPLESYNSPEYAFSYATNTLNGGVCKMTIEEIIKAIETKIKNAKEEADGYDPNHPGSYEAWGKIKAYEDCLAMLEGMKGETK